MDENEELKPTPGPWRVVGKQGVSVYSVPISGAEQASICIATGRSFREAKSNALLIAAAPELLAMLEALWLEAFRYSEGKPSSLELLGPMVAVRDALDRLHGSAEWRADR